ncbi:MAG TPA: response regulator, partial [Ideonella sp.]|nr:response regulator [Ideonella sp.]
QAKAAARAAVRRAQRRGRAALADSTDVLVLDDSEIALRYLCKLLGDFGFRVHPARDGQAAWALCERQRFAAAFVDMRLDADDAVDGIAICQQLKGRPPDDVRGAARVLLVSGSGQPADEVRARLAGCDAFLAKPLTRGSVARALDDCGVALPADARRG